MPQTINTNVASLNAQRNLNTSQTSLATSMQRLSSGLRVNSAKDDAAGLAIAERMNAQVRGMNVAIRNANDGISLAQTAEGALGKVATCCSACASWRCSRPTRTNGTGDRANLDTEFQQLAAGSRPHRSAAPSSTALAILGTDAGAQVFQVGANNGRHDRRDHHQPGGTPCTHRGRDRRQHHRSAATSATAHGRHRRRARRRSTPSRATYGAAQNRFEAVIATCRSPRRTRRPRAAASWTPTSPPKPPTCRARRSCSRPAPPWWRRPTSCRSRCCSCCSS